MMQARTRHALGTVALGTAMAIGLTGCTLDATPFGQTVTPWVVADHDAKVAYHAGAGEELLSVDITAQFAQLQGFQAVGYNHVESEASSLHVEYETSANGEGYVSRLVTDRQGYSFDQSHEAGSSKTYFLVGDKLKSVASQGKSWVSVPAGDLGRFADPERTCSLFAVSYLCTIVAAWQDTRETEGEVPVMLSRSQDGQRLFTTAVTLASLGKTGLLINDGRIDGFASAEQQRTLVPMHLWVDENGLVTKAEVNGTLTGDDGSEAKLQIGFELTSQQASTTMVPVTDAQVPKDDLYVITTQSQFETFLDKISR